MLTIQQLLSTPGLGLRLLTTPAGPGEVAEPAGELPATQRAITWVHVSELPDPTPFLSGGELLLTTGLSFRAEQSAAETQDYVQRLADAAVVGLGFGIGLSHEHVPPALVEAGVRCGLPIIEVSRQTPFIAISRAVSKAVAADEYAAVTRTFAAQQALTKAALSDAGTDRVARLLAQQMDGWVVLLEPAGTVLAEYPAGPRSRTRSLAAEIAALAGHQGTVSSAFPLGTDLVSLQSVGAGSRGRAFLAVGRPAPLTAGDRHLVNAAVMLLTLRLEHSSTTEAGLHQLRSAILRLVLSGQFAAARPIADQLSAPLPAEPISVLVSLGAAAGSRSAVDDPPRWAGQVFTADLDDDVVALVGGDAADAADYARHLVADAGIDAAVGISPPGGYEVSAASHHQAQQAAAYGRRARRPVTTFEQIAMPGITGLLDPQQAGAFADSVLRPLVEHDRTGRGDLVASVRSWLAHHGQWEPAATELGIHRHTLRHRITTAGQLLGRDLDSPGVRSELWLALEISHP